MSHLSLPEVWGAHMQTQMMWVLRLGDDLSCDIEIYFLTNQTNPQISWFRVTPFPYFHKGRIKLMYNFLPESIKWFYEISISERKGTTAFSHQTIISSITDAIISFCYHCHRSLSPHFQLAFALPPYLFTFCSWTMEDYFAIISRCVSALERTRFKAYTFFNFQEVSASLNVKIPA